MTQAELAAVFLLAEFPIKGFHMIDNQYWPPSQTYDEVRAKNPWYVVETEFGPITLGWRKRVIQISWKDTGYQLENENDVTQDDVTKSQSMIHAWNFGDAVNYLGKLQRCLKRLQYLKNNPQPTEH